MGAGPTGDGWVACYLGARSSMSPMDVRAASRWSTPEQRRRSDKSRSVTRPGASWHRAGP